MPGGSIDRQVVPLSDVHESCRAVRAQPAPDGSTAAVAIGLTGSILTASAVIQPVPAARLENRTVRSPGFRSNVPRSTQARALACWSTRTRWVPAAAATSTGTEAFRLG